MDVTSPVSSRLVRIRQMVKSDLGHAIQAVFCAVIFLLAVSCRTSDHGKPAISGEKAEDRCMVFNSIGVVHSPYTPEKGAPRQGWLAPDVESTIELDPEFEKCLEGNENYSNIIVLYYFDRSKGWNPIVERPGVGKRRGLFATCSPRRPNPIGMTEVKLVKRSGSTLHVLGLDAYDNTPVLDIKPVLHRCEFEDGSRL